MHVPCFDIRTVKTDLVKRPSTNSLFRRGSTFRFSGRTQFRLLQEGTQTKRRSSRGFERSVKVGVWSAWLCIVRFPPPPSLSLSLGSAAEIDLHARPCEVQRDFFYYILSCKHPLPPYLNNLTIHTHLSVHVSIGRLSCLSFFLFKCHTNKTKKWFVMHQRPPEVSALINEYH